MNIIEHLKWRYACKRMTGARIPDEALAQILEAIRLAPSSGGLQPYKVIVVGNPTLKERIYEQAAQQAQVLECSHLLVFAAWRTVSIEKVETYIQNIAQTREQSLESLDGFKKNLLELCNKLAEENFAWAAKQSYIPIGTAILAAAALGIDACPMEGFDPEKLNAVLGLDTEGLGSTVIMALGYRNPETDFLWNKAKVRRAAKDFFIMKD